MQSDICGNAVVFTPEETKKLFDGTCFAGDRFKSLLQKKVVALILEHHHGILPVCPTKLIVERFSIHHEERPYHGDYAIEVIYRFDKRKWRQVFHYVRCPKGSLSGRLYTNRRHFIEK